MDYSKQQFERLFKDSYPHMYRMAFSLVENADDAKDAVHQVFVQMWRGKPEIATESIRGYLLAATRNQCLHILRDRQLRRRLKEELLKETAWQKDEEREELLQQLQQETVYLSYSEQVKQVNLPDSDTDKARTEVGTAYYLYNKSVYPGKHSTDLLLRK